MEISNDINNSFYPLKVLKDWLCPCLCWKLSYSQFPWYITTEKDTILQPMEKVYSFSSKVLYFFFFFLPISIKIFFIQFTLLFSWFWVLENNFTLQSPLFQLLCNFLQFSYNFQKYLLFNSCWGKLKYQILCCLCRSHSRICPNRHHWALTTSQPLIHHQFSSPTNLRKFQSFFIFLFSSRFFLNFL